MMGDDRGALSADMLMRGGNALLALLPSAELARLARDAERVTLARGHALTQPDQPIDAAYFIERGIASVIKPDGRGERTEICMLGPEGLSGAPLITADGRWPYLTFVQSEELRAVRVPADALRAAAARGGALHTLIIRYAHAATIQIAEGLVSAAWQTLPARLARWLLMYRDRLGTDRIPVTHEFIAMMIGSQRTGITLALHELEGAGMIAASRGLIVMRDRHGLEQLADGNYGTAEAAYARLFSR